jgi:alpha-methylacyl-CoA racemase
MRLDDVRVLDLTRLLPGPYATQLLADFGADVVKVEDTGAGDYARAMPPYTDRGTGVVFDAVNRGKRSIALDLKSEDGQGAFYRLVETADVVVEGFRPGVTERLGIDYATLSGYNDTLVYCSLSGYGQSGPLSTRAAHDLNYIGVAGLLDMTREDDGERPRIPGYPIGDMAGGLFAGFAIVTALLSRELGGGGEYLDCTLTDPVVSFSQVVSMLGFDGDPRPGETPLTGEYPWYDVYAAKEGYVTIAALEPQFWEAFCAAVDREALLDAHLTEDPAEREALRAELEALFAERTRDEWVDLLGDVDAAVEGVYSPAETLDHPQIASRGYVRDPDEAPSRVATPLSEPTDESVPDQGEHTAQLLAEVGVDHADLRETGVVR